MKVNLCLVVGGLLMMGIGAYRSYPLKIGVPFALLNGGPFAMLVIFIGMASWAGGMPYAVRGVQGAVQVTASYLPMMVMLFPLISFGEVVATHYHEPLSKALSGTFGYFGTFAAAFLLPGGNTASGFVKKAWADPLIRPQLLYFLTVSPLVSWNIFLIRQMGLGAGIASAMYKTNFAVALAIAPFFWAWSRMIR